MPTSTAPLEPQDIALLQRVGVSTRSAQTALVVCSGLLVGCAGALVWLGREVASLPGLALAMNVAALLVLLAAPGLLWLAKRRNRQATAAIDGRIGQGQKFVVCGTLQEATAQAPGRVRYTVDGDAVDTFPVLGLDRPGTHPPGRPLRAFSALANTPIELHCIGWNDQGYLLLRVHYPLTRQPARDRRVATAADRRRAGQRDRRFVAFVALGLAALAVFIAWQIGFDRPLSGFVGGYMALIWALVFAFSVVPVWLRARRATHLHTVHGPVTEILVAPVPTGKHTVESRWYRVDGQLFPSFDIDGEAQLGNQVTIEWLGGEHGEDGGRVVSLQRSAPGVGV